MRSHPNVRYYARHLYRTMSNPDVFEFDWDSLASEGWNAGDDAMVDVTGTPPRQAEGNSGQEAAVDLRVVRNRPSEQADAAVRGGPDPPLPSLPERDGDVLRELRLLSSQMSALRARVSNGHCCNATARSRNRGTRTVGTQTASGVQGSDASCMAPPAGPPRTRGGRNGARRRRATGNGGGSLFRQRVDSRLGRREGSPAVGGYHAQMHDIRRQFNQQRRGARSGPRSGVGRTNGDSR